MATKCTVIGKNPSENEGPIEFVGFIDDTLEYCGDVTSSPSSFKYIELIARKYDGRCDMMFAHNGKRPDGVLFFGYWNGGFVE